MSSHILPLDSPLATLAQVGGKGANLSELLRAGFTVPPGFLVTTAAYRAFVLAGGFGERLLALAQRVVPDDPIVLEQVSAEIRGLFTHAPLPEPIAQTICAAYRELGAVAVAVRSSATAEDLPGLSFAGQQDTYLNIMGEAALLDAVRRCWASLWTARAMGYRARNHIAPDDVALAVVVQTMVQADVAGVLFTANPLTGRRDEMVIDASFGLGEALVSGQVEPDHYVVDARNWHITARKLGAKALAIVARPDGGTQHTTPNVADQQALSDTHILMLAQLAARVAAHFGVPQDIEWALSEGTLWLVQSRPITALYPLPAPTVSTGGVRVYFSFNSVQGVMDPFTPLGSSALRALIGGLLRQFNVQRPADDIIGDAGGRLFLDVTDIVADPGLRHLYLTMMLHVDPGARETILRLIAEKRIATASPRRRLPGPTRSQLRLVRTLLPMLGRALAAIQAPDYSRARVQTRIHQYLEDTRREIATIRTLPELLDHMAWRLGDVIPSLFGHIMPIIFPGIVMLMVLDQKLEAWLGLEKGSALRLARGLPDNVTTEMDLRLWATAQTIRADAQAAAAVCTQPVEALVADYQRNALPTVAQHAIAQFLDRYGMRAVAEIDLGRPRWRDDPTAVLRILAGYLALDDPALAPDRLFQQGADEATRLAADYVARVRQTRGGWWRARLVAAAAYRIRRMVGLRETPKFSMIQILDMYRSALRTHAHDLVRQGQLAHAEDIFFVPITDLKRAAQDATRDLRPIVAAQRAAYDQECARRQMPRVLLSTGEAFYEGISEDGTNDLIGDAVSPGVVEGRVRVVRDPRGVQLEPGEILVCPATDPGWTPLFLTAGGLVMELGGMITHGSVVAREYGIPAVVGVHDATTRLSTGQRVRVDGSRGRVIVLDEAPDS